MAGDGTFSAGGPAGFSLRAESAPLHHRMVKTWGGPPGSKVLGLVLPCGSDSAGVGAARAAAFLKMPGEMPPGEGR